MREAVVVAGVCVVVSIGSPLPQAVATDKNVDRISIRESIRKAGCFISFSSANADPFVEK